MKKIIIFLLVLFFCVSVVAQPITQRSSATITVMDARLKTQYNLVMPCFSDTTAANLQIGIDSCGAVIYTYADKAGWFRQCSPKKWVLFGSSGGNNNADTIYTEIPIAVKIDSLGRHIIYFLRPNGLYGGGIVTVDSCMTLDITPPTIVVNYKQYTGLQTIGVVVQTADPSLPRIDRVVMDTSLNIIVIEGMPSATPVPPEYNSFSQVSLAEIPVGAAITCLGNAEIIFDGVADFAGQWTITTSGTGVTSFINTANPYHLTQASYTVTYSNGYKIIYTKPSGTDTVKATSVLKGFITVVGNFTNQIIGQWYNGSTAVSNQLLLNSYFNVNDSNNYQIFSPQLSAWSWPGGTVYNKLVLSFGGNDNSGSNGVYLDWLQIQTGIGNAGNKQYQDSSSIVDGFLTDWYNGVPITRQAVGGGGGSGINIYNTDSLLSGDRQVDLNNHTIQFVNSPGGTLLSVIPYSIPNDFQSGTLAAHNPTGSDNLSQVQMVTSDTSAVFSIYADYQDGTKLTEIEAASSNGISTLEYTADTHTFNGTIIYNAPPSGAATDSIRTWDAATGAERMRDAASFGGGPAGQNTWVQYNNNGVFGADSNFVWDKANTILTLSPSSFSGVTIAAGLVNTTDQTSTFNILGANSPTSSGNAGGDIQIKSGNGDGTQGAGAISILVGDAGLTGTGSQLTLNAGNGGATSGNGGNVDINAGSFSGGGNHDGAINLATSFDINIGTGNTDAVSINNAYSIPVVDGTNGQVISTNGSGVGSWKSAAIVAASADLTAQSAAVSSIATFTPTANGTFRIGGYVNVTAIVTNVITLKVTYTDINSNAVTQIIPLTLAATGAVGTTATIVGNNSATDIQIRAKSGSAITVLTTATGVGSEVYDVGCSIEKLR